MATSMARDCKTLSKFHTISVEFYTGLSVWSGCWLGHFHSTSEHVFVRIIL